MRILGIDPGYGITGFGLIESERGQNRLLQCGAITTPPGTDFSWRLEVIYNDMVELLRVGKPDVVAIEELFFGQNGNVAYVGGGFGVGIHNTLEAAVYGMPVVFGPAWEKFREAKGLIDAGAAISVKNYKDLAGALDCAFANQETMGQKANDYVQSESGATERIYGQIFSL